MRLPFPAAHLSAHRLIGDSVSAKHAAMHQQGRLTLDVVHGAIVQQSHPGSLGERIAEQEVAIADHEINRDTSLTHGACGCRDTPRKFGVIVDPGLDQVAKDVQRVGVADLVTGEIVLEQGGDLWSAGIQMEIGNEQRGRRATQPFLAGVVVLAFFCADVGFAGAEALVAGAGTSSPITCALLITTSGLGTSPAGGTCAAGTPP